MVGADLGTELGLCHGKLDGNLPSANLVPNSARTTANSMERCSVLMRDGAIVGYAVCRDNVIDLMMIDSPVHRQGLGTELLRHIGHALSQSCDVLRLESFEGNEKANAFSRKNGWREVSRYFDKDSGVNKVVFENDLKWPQWEGSRSRALDAALLAAGFSPEKMDTLDPPPPRPPGESAPPTPRAQK